MLKTVVLDCADIRRVRSVRDNLAVLGVRLKVLRREIVTYSVSLAGNNTDGIACNAALIIRDQPPPRVLFKGKDILSIFRNMLFALKVTRY